MEATLRNAGRTRYQFPRSRRLLQRAEFGRVFAAKRVFIDEELILHTAANGGQPTRLGLAIGRKVGNAVRRNRIKRLIREAFRLNQHRFPDGLDLVVVVRKGAQLTFETISASLCGLVARAGARLPSSAVAQPPSAAVFRQPGAAAPHPVSEDLS